MRRYVLDAGVLSLYFAGHEGSRRYIEEAFSTKSVVMMCEINLAEFLYNYAKVFGWEAALVKNTLIRGSPIRIVGIDESMTLEAAKLKVKHYNTLSLADCYLISLARREKGVVITTDSRVKEVGEVPTEVIRY